MAASASFHLGCLDGGLAKLNTGGANATGKLRWKEADGDLIATALLSNPAFLPAATIAGPPIEYRALASTVQPSDAPTPSAIIGRIEFIDRGDTHVLDLSVGLSGSGASLIIDNNEVHALAANITVNSLAIRLALTAT